MHVTDRTAWPRRAAMLAGVWSRRSFVPTAAGAALCSSAVQRQQPDAAAACSGSRPTLLATRAARRGLALPTR